MAKPKTKKPRYQIREGHIASIQYMDRGGELRKVRGDEVILSDTKREKSVGATMICEKVILNKAFRSPSEDKMELLNEAIQQLENGRTVEEIEQFLVRKGMK